MFGLVLDANAVRAHRAGTKAAAQCPHETGEEHETSGIADQCVSLVDATVEELERLGQLMVDLERGGHGHEDEEAEVDHRVHDSGDRITHECLHVQTGAHVVEALFDVLLVVLRFSGAPRCQFLTRNDSWNPT